MRCLRDQLHWNFRIRVKSSAQISSSQSGWKQLNQYHLAAGNVFTGDSIDKTKPLCINLAIGRDPISGQQWWLLK